MICGVTVQFSLSSIFERGAGAIGVDVVVIVFGKVEVGIVGVVIADGNPELDG